VAETALEPSTTAARGLPPGSASLSAPARLPLKHALGIAVSFVFLIALGIFRGGALLPADRARFGAAVILVGVVWFAATVAPGSEEVHGLRAALRLDGLLSVPLWALTGLCFWSGLSALWSLDAVRSLVAAALLLGGLVYYAGGLLLAQRSWRGRPIVLLVVSGIGTAVAAPSLLGFVLQWDGWITVIEGVRHAQGPLGYANALAGLMLLSVPASVGLAVREWPFVRRRGWLAPSLIWAAIVIQLVVAWTTRSRGAFLSVAATLMLWALIWCVRAFTGRTASATPTRRILAAAVVTVCVLALLAGAVVEFNSLCSAPKGADRARVGTWNAGLLAARERPLAGWGADQWFEAYSPLRTESYFQAPPTRYAHDLFVQSAVELGAVGTLIVLAIVVAVLGLGFRRGHPRSALFWLSLASSAFLLQNLVDLTWYIPALFCLFWFFVGAQVGLLQARD
jgi:O-antigen ligase